MSWQIDYNDDVPSQVHKLMKSGIMNEDDYLTIRMWVKQVKRHGPDSVVRVERITPDHKY